MAMPTKNNKLINAVELISEQGFAGMAEAMQILLNEAMLVERTRHLQAEPYERAESRQDYANGFKPKWLKTQVGELSLNVPQARVARISPNIESCERLVTAVIMEISEQWMAGKTYLTMNNVN